MINVTHLDKALLYDASHHGATYLIVRLTTVLSLHVGKYNN